MIDNLHKNKKIMFVKDANICIQKIANVSFYIFSVVTFLVMTNIISKQVINIKMRRMLKRKLTTDHFTLSVFKNLQLTSNINYFLIILLFLECFQSFTALLFDFTYSRYNSTELRNFPLTNSCVITYPAVSSLKSLSGWWIHVPIRVSKILHLILYPLINLLLDMLYFSYLASSCSRVVCRGSVWIIIRFVLLFILSSVFETTIVGFWFLAKLYLVYDLQRYIRLSIRFYRVLRGMRDEEKYHGSKLKFKRKDTILKQFLVSNSLLLILLINKALAILFTDWGLAMEVLIVEPCYFSYITHGIVHLVIPAGLVVGYRIAFQYIEFVAGLFFMVYQGMSILLYSLLLLDTLLGLCSANCSMLLRVVVTRKRELNVDDKIKPLIDRYHKDVGIK